MYLLFVFNSLYHIEQLSQCIYMDTWSLFLLINLICKREMGWILKMKMLKAYFVFSILVFKQKPVYPKFLLIPIWHSSNL